MTRPIARKSDLDILRKLVLAACIASPAALILVLVSSSAGFTIPVWPAVGLAAGEMAVGWLLYLLARYAKIPWAPRAAIWTYIAITQVIITGAIGISGAVLSPFTWFYLIPICVNAYCVSPLAAYVTGGLASVAFTALLWFKELNWLPHRQWPGGFDPYDYPGVVFSQWFGSIALYWGFAVMVAWALNQLLRQQRSLESMTQGLAAKVRDLTATQEERSRMLVAVMESREEASQAEAMKSSLLDALSRRHMEALKANKDLSDTKAALLNVMDDLRDTAEAREREHTRLQVLLDGLPEGVFMADEADRMLLWSRTAAVLTGWGAAEVLAGGCGRIHELSTEAPPCEARCVLRGIMFSRTALPQAGVCSMLRKDGQIVMIAVSHAPVTTQEGRPLGGVQVFRDVTQEMALAQVKEDFLHTVAHDIKAPLATMAGYAQLLELSDTDPALAKDYARAIHRGAKQLIFLVNNLLGSARLDEGHTVCRPGPVPANLLAQDAHQRVAALAEARGITIRCAVDPGLTVLADPDLLREIMLNLLTNAIKFSPEGGEIECLARRIGDQVEMSVRDRGPGLLPAEHGRIFQKFTRAAGDQGKGTGLGLYLVRRLLELHGAQIHVASDPAREPGARFWFRLPVATKNSAAPPAHAGPKAVPNGHLQVLIIEDDEQQARLLAGIVRGAGWSAEVAFSAVAGLEAAARLRPRAITLDYNLPDATGDQVVAALRQDPATRLIPILLVTNMNVNEAPGAYDGMLQKPVSAAALIATLRSVWREPSGVPA